MNTTLRTGSAAKTVHELAAPLWCALGPIQVADAGSTLLCGTGSNVHRRAPVRASYPRTSPLAASIRLLSATPEPTTTTPSTTVAGEVSSYSEANAGGFLNPSRRFTVPPAPNCVHGDPVAASRAMRRVSMVATKIRSAHGERVIAVLSSQSATPRLA